MDCFACQHVAGALHFSAAYVSHIVKRQTDYAFQMLLIMRMEAATRLLRQTKMPADQIAASVGLTGKTSFYGKYSRILRRQSRRIQVKLFCVQHEAHAVAGTVFLPRLQMRGNVEAFPARLGTAQTARLRR